MSDFSVRSDNVDVEQIMRQIRSRIREKRGVDYSDEEIRELANVKLEKFLDPKGVRSNLLEEYRRARTAEPPPPNFAFEDDTLFETHRAPIRWLRRLLKPILKLFLNINPLIQSLHIQSGLNARAAQREAAREPLQYELIHNLVIELTRATVELKNLKMRVESMSSRLDFDERRARALEGVVQYRPGTVPPLQPPSAGSPAAGAGRAAATPGSQNDLDTDGNERRARRRRRRGRRRPGEDGRRDDRPSTGRSDDNGGGPESAGSGAADQSAQGDRAEPRMPDSVRRTPDAGPRPSSGRDAAADTPPADLPSE